MENILNFEQVTAFNVGFRRLLKPNTNHQKYLHNSGLAIRIGGRS